MLPLGWFLWWLQHVTKTDWQWSNNTSVWFISMTFFSRAILSLRFRLSHLLPKKPGLRPWMRRGVPLPFHLMMETPLCQLHNQVHKRPQTQREKTDVRAPSPAPAKVRNKNKWNNKKRQTQLLCYQVTFGDMVCAFGRTEWSGLIQCCGTLKCHN